MIAGSRDPAHYAPWLVPAVAAHVLIRG